VEDHTPPTITCAGRQDRRCAVPGPLIRPPPATPAVVRPSASSTPSPTPPAMRQHLRRDPHLARHRRLRQHGVQSKVTVEDHTPPTITCAGNKIVECGSPWSFDPPTPATPAVVRPSDPQHGNQHHRPCGSTFDVTPPGAPPMPAVNTADCSQKSPWKIIPADHHLRRQQDRRVRSPVL